MILLCRTLVKQALDILIPTLQKRLAAPDTKFTHWLRFTKKIIIEEGRKVMTRQVTHYKCRP